jgi:hypothetical protein
VALESSPAQRLALLESMALAVAAGAGRLVTLSPEPMNSAPRREVHCAEAVAWMRARGTLPAACAITSLPDVSEVGRALPVWRAWFLEVVGLVVEAVPAESAAGIFPERHQAGRRWIDKGAMVTRAAEEAGARVLFHKIVRRRPPGTVTGGRPGYTHLIAVSRGMVCPDVLPMPDVITDAGAQKWVRAMGVRAAAHAVRFARDQVGAKVVFDPFCGVGDGARGRQRARAGRDRRGVVPQAGRAGAGPAGGNGGA